MDPEKPWLLAASYWLLPKFGRALLCSLIGVHLEWLVSACSPKRDFPGFCIHELLFSAVPSGSVVDVNL